MRSRCTCTQTCKKFGAGIALLIGIANKILVITIHKGTKLSNNKKDQTSRVCRHRPLSHTLTHGGQSLSADVTT